MAFGTALQMHPIWQAAMTLKLKDEFKGEFTDNYRRKILFLVQI